MILISDDVIGPENVYVAIRLVFGCIELVIRWPCEFEGPFLLSKLMSDAASQCQRCPTAEMCVDISELRLLILDTSLHNFDSEILISTIRSD